MTAKTRRRAPRSKVAPPQRGAFGAGPETSRAIRAAAVSLFRRNGFEATPMRELAGAVGIEAASLYNHLGSKDQLLADILVGTMGELLVVVEAAIEEAAPDPVSRLSAVVRAYVLFHAENLEAASITDTERRSLNPKDHAKLLQQRKRLAGMIRAVLRDGVDKGVFDCIDESLAVVSILSICARLAVWYHPDGRLSLERIADIFVLQCLRMVGVVKASGAKKG